MSDTLDIRLTEAELDLILELLEETDAEDAPELRIDLLEQAGRWSEIDPTELAEDQMFNAGTQAREMLKAASRSEVQKHDLWEKPANDPVDW
tara:strand:+ start:1203 stop:1478 length:276 start_codon:yes stop_codon:yes gene_type:complete